MEDWNFGGRFENVCEVGVGVRIEILGGFKFV